MTVYNFLFIEKPYLIVMMAFLIAKKNSLFRSVRELACSVLFSNMSIRKTSKYSKMVVGRSLLVPKLVGRDEVSRSYRSQVFKVYSGGDCFCPKFAG